ARVAARRRREPWWIASYSALVQAGHVQDAPQDDARHAAAADTARQDVVREIARVRPDPGAGAGGRPSGVHAFPRGPEAGTFLHGLLEWAAAQGFARVAADRAGLRDAVARRAQVRGWTAWIDPLADWLLGLFGRPLAAGESAPDFTLAGLASYN